MDRKKGRNGTSSHFRASRSFCLCYLIVELIICYSFAVSKCTSVLDAPFVYIDSIDWKSLHFIFVYIWMKLFKCVSPLK